MTSKTLTSRKRYLAITYARTRFSFDIVLAPTRLTAARRVTRRGTRTVLTPGEMMKLTRAFYTKSDAAVERKFIRNMERAR